MNNEEEIRNILELYQRNELDPNKKAEVKTRLESDPSWQEIQSQLITESQGIRLSQLQDLQSKLQNLEATEKKVENNGSSKGDLLKPQSFISETNETNDLESIEVIPVSKLDSQPDSRILQGIRYTRLREELKKLQEGEEKMFRGISNNKKEIRYKRDRVILMPRYWWLTAVGVAVIVVLAWPAIRPKTYAEKLIAKGFVVPPMTDLIRGGDENDTIQMIVQKAYGAYAEGKYKLALNYFNAIPLQDNENYYIYYVTTLYLNDNNKYIDILSVAKRKWPNNKIFLNLFN